MLPVVREGDRGWVGPLQPLRRANTAAAPSAAPKKSGRISNLWGIPATFFLLAIVAGAAHRLLAMDVVLLFALVTIVVALVWEVVRRQRQERISWSITWD